MSEREESLRELSRRRYVLKFVADLELFAHIDKKPKVSPAASTAPSPGPVVNQLDEFARETFATGHPLEDPPALKTCKHCKKSILLSAAKAHIAGCLKIKKEKAQRKKEAREMRERQREKAAREAREEEGGGETASDGEEDGEKKVNGGKTTKKVGGKKNDTGDMKGKKRKAEGDPDKGPKQKKKKDEPKAKLPKPKGEFPSHMVIMSLHSTETLQFSKLDTFPTHFTSKYFILSICLLNENVQDLSTSNGNVVSSIRRPASLAHDRSLVKATVWEPSDLLPEGLCRMICCLQHIRRRIRRNNKVS